MPRNNKSSSLPSVILLLILVIVIGLALPKYMPSVFNRLQAQPLSKEDVRSIVKEYIADNPQEIIDSVNNFQQKKAQDMQDDARKKFSSNKENLTDNSPVGGNPAGDVTIIEFFDYACGYCKHSAPETHRLVKEDKNIKFVYKQLPILGENSEKAAQFALAVYHLDKSKFEEYHNVLMAMSPLNSEEAMIAAATKLGINEDALKKEAKSSAVMQEITKNRNLAPRIGIHGTPAFIIGDELVPGALPYDELKDKVTAARKKSASKPATKSQADNAAPAAAKNAGKPLKDEPGPDDTASTKEESTPSAAENPPAE